MSTGYQDNRGCHVKQMTENECCMPGVWTSFQSRLRSHHWRVFLVLPFCFAGFLSWWLTWLWQIRQHEEAKLSLVIFATMISFLIKKQENKEVSQDMCFKFAKTKCNMELIWPSSKAIFKEILKMFKAFKIHTQMLV